MTSPYIRTFSGHDLVLDRPTGICIEDIATALSRLPRFNGHTREPYSVAQHCLWVEGMMGLHGESATARLAGLMHDAPEAYLGDMPTPVQWHVFGRSLALPSAWEEAHLRLMADVVTQLRLPFSWPVMGPCVKRYDQMALRTEWRDLMTGAEPEGFATLPTPDGGRIRPLPSWQVARDCFLRTFTALCTAAATETLR